MIADIVTWLLLAQLLGESEDAQGDAFVQGVRYPVSSGASWNPPSPREPIYVFPARSLEAIAYDAWRAIHEYLDVKLVDQPVVRDDVEREFLPGQIVRIFMRKK